MAATTADPAFSPGAGDAAHHPAVSAHLAQRAGNLQVRLADAITRFAGSMAFVYVHILVFAVWMLVFERSPWPTLTLVVSLEAIFLSTFVMIGQNRQASFQQAKADHDFVAQEQELHGNTEITQAIHELTRQIHAVVVATSAGGAAARIGDRIGDGASGIGDGAAGLRE